MRRLDFPAIPNAVSDLAVSLSGFGGANAPRAVQSVAIAACVQKRRTKKGPAVKPALRALGIEPYAEATGPVHQSPGGLGG